MNNKKILIYIGSLLVIIVIIIIAFMVFNPVLCKGENVCIVDSGGIKKVKKMKFDNNNLYSLISIEDAKINKIEGLENQQSLNDLDLAGNNITKIEGLDKLVGLKGLDLSNNQISKIEGLDNLDNLEYIYLQDNPINVVENIESINYSEGFIWYLPAEATSITRESYKFLKENPNVEVYFVEEGSNIHEAVSNKTIDDLTII